jgi:hypothetical protein
MVLEIRQQMPKIGARKLYYLLGNDVRIQTKVNFS